VEPGDLDKYRVPSDPRLHPDGRRVAFVVTRMDLEEDRYERSIWLWDGTEARPLTSGTGDRMPRWSPDGTRLAFLRAGQAKGDVPQVAVLRADGGEATVVTDFSLGAREVAWSPDGSSLAVVGVEWAGEWADLDEEERARRPRRITRMGYRADDAGWSHDRRSHVYLVDPAGGADARCLTPGEFDESGVAWHPDGSELAFLSARHETRGIDHGTRVWAVPAAGGAAVARTPVGWWSEVTYAPDGALHAVGDPDRWRFPDVFPLRREAAGEWVEVVPGLDRSLVAHAPPVAPSGPQWLDGGGFLSTLEDEGRIRVIRFDGEEVHDVVGGDRAVTGVSPRPDGSAFAFVASTPTDPGEVHWWEGGEERRLTDLNRSFRDRADLVEPRPLRFDHEGTTIDGWVYLPPGDGPVPLLLNIHGGPAAQYGYGFFDEFQVYAAAGYGVVATNPRGSSGYGADHLRAVVGMWAEPDPPDLRDLRRAVAVALERYPRLDPDHLGVMGGSYGGLMTARLTAHDGRYRSAVAERGLYSWPSFGGTSDIGTWFGRAYLGADHVEGHDLWRRASPLTEAPAITTPTLIIHSENDLRTPVEQGEQLFALLQARGVPCEMLRFPSEGHEMSRSGSPRHRRERFEAILEWHARHLQAN
jgi:dipeptidyl aminopeptidase/acylaminoacyl peptidase